MGGGRKAYLDGLHFGLIEVCFVWFVCVCVGMKFDVVV
jgi:hypothetical protein